MPIEINDLESKRFGIVAARLTDARTALEAVDRAAAAAGVDMLTTRVEVADLTRVHALEKAGFRLMDTLVYYSRTLTDSPPDTSARVHLRQATPADASAIGALAQAAFSNYIGHYHADPRLDNQTADAAYVEWAETSVANCTDDAPALVAEENSGPLGFLTLRRNTAEEFEIVLNAVHPEAKGKGVYTALVAEALIMARDAGADRITVSTQINNYAVQRVWARLGFAHIRSLYTFHKWYDR